MDSILADINYATQNIRTVNDPTRTLITRWVAYAFKARICLFEGTFRKYHTELGTAVTGTSSTWLTEAAGAAKKVMEESGFKLYEGAGVAGSYRRLFTSVVPVSDEIMLAAVSDVALGVLHASNWYYPSSTTGVRFSFIRSFIHTYLNIDGTPFTNRANYQTFSITMKRRTVFNAWTARASRK